MFLFSFSFMLTCASLVLFLDGCSQPETTACISDASDCFGLPDGNYQSCHTCYGYAACVAGYVFYDMPCPQPLVWDDTSKRCEWTSRTCCPCGLGFLNYVFTIDESFSVGPTNYVASIDFVIELIEDHLPLNSQIAALAFSTGTDFIYGFSDVQTPRDDLIAALIVEKSDDQWGLTHTSDALAMAVDQFEVAGYTSDNMIILITDGDAVPDSQSPCPTTGVSDVKQEIDDLNIRVVIVRVGSFDENEVACLVQDASDIISIDDFGQLNTVIDELVTLDCVCHHE
eukprot:UN00982